PEKMFKISSEWIKEEPDNPIPNYMIWTYYVNKGQRTKLKPFEKRAFGTSADRSNADKLIAFFEGLRAHKKKEDDLRYESSIAHICYNINRYKKAIELYDILLDKFPDYAIGHMIIAKSYSAIGNDKASIYHYKRAARLQENNPEVNYQLAYLYKKNKQYDAAEKACKTVIRKNPEYIDVYPLLLRIYMDKKEYEQAIQSGKKMIDRKIDPDNYIFYFHVANAYLNSGKYVEALKYFNLARKQKKKLNDNAYYDYAGRCYLGQGKLEEAEKLLLKSLALKQYPSVYYYLGKLYEEKKDYSQARKYYNKVMTGDFDKEWQSKAQERLANISK
ncbi:MAG: tetratricopeptide repeat protein, partial [Proteobacteria bacterium]|nr:tetratricopeptide repeat protein [Pseudomonadota bacterium]